MEGSLEIHDERQSNFERRRSQGMQNKNCVCRRAQLTLCFTVQYGSEGITFKVPTPTRWIVFVTDPKLITEIRESPKLSFTAAADEVCSSSIQLSACLT